MFSWFSSRKRSAQPESRGQRRLFIPESLYRRIVKHCQEERPLEACGIMAGEGGHVVAAYATDNEHRSPWIYKVDERQLIEAFRDLQSNRQDLVAIYHSHVQTEAVPSRTDIEQATWPEAFYVIVSLVKDRPEMRAWRIVDKQVTEHKIVIVPEAPGQWRDLRHAVRAAAESEKRNDIP